MNHVTKIDPQVTTGSLPASTKIHLAGEIHPDIRVPMRQIALHPTAGEPPVVIYDTSGSYTDPDGQIDIGAGLALLREDWIAVRGDSAPYTGRSVQDADNGFTPESHLVPAFPVKPVPRRAVNGAAVTQLAYARAGVITPEMEFVAIRENVGRTQTSPRDGEDFGAAIPVNGGVKSDHWAAQNQASGETLSAMARVLTT